MTRAVVIYDSMFGNTEKIAKALAEGLTNGGASTDCKNIHDASDLSEYDFIAIGGPTHIASMSKPMKEFLNGLNGAKLCGKKGFSFDTRNDSRFNAFDLNSAAKRIEGKMKKMGIKIILKRRSAIVEGREGPLIGEAVKDFRQTGEEIAESLR